MAWQGRTGAEDIVDVIFPVRGDCVHVGYSYPLFAALTSQYMIKGRPDIWIGPLEGVEPMGRGLLAITRRSQLRLRAPSTSLDFVPSLSGARLIVGGHVIGLGSPRVLALRPAATLHAEFVTFAFIKDGAHRSGDMAKWFDRVSQHFASLRPDQVHVGALRALTISGRKTLGHPIELRHLHEPDSLRIQRDGLGGRKHMGGGVFVPGPLPRMLRSDARPQRRQRPRRRVYVPGDSP